MGNTRAGHEQTMTLRTAIIDAMRDNVGDEFTAREISDAVALTDNLSLYLDHANPVQIGAVLRAMCDDGLVKKRRHHEGTLYQLMPAALDWVPPAYDWRKHKISPVPFPAGGNHQDQDQDNAMALAELRAELEQAKADISKAQSALADALGELFHVKLELDRSHEIVEKQRRGLPILPPAWMGRLRLTMASYAEGADSLRIDIYNEGGGAYARIKADLTTDPGDMDWLPRLSDGLIALYENLFPHLTIRHEETVSQASQNVPVISDGVVA